MINHSPALHPQVRQAGKQLFHFFLASFRLAGVPGRQAGERNKNTPQNQITDYKKAFFFPVPFWESVCIIKQKWIFRNASK